MCVYPTWLYNTGFKQIKNVFKKWRVVPETYVEALFDESREPLLVGLAGADGGADEELLVGVFRGVREVAVLLEEGVCVCVCVCVCVLRGREKEEEGWKRIGGRFY